MQNYKYVENHVVHCMLFHFNCSLSATTATLIISSIYAHFLKERKCQRQINRFRCENFDIEDDPKIGCPDQFYNQFCKILRKTILAEEMNKFQKMINASWSTFNTTGRTLENFRIPIKSHLFSDTNKYQKSIVSNFLINHNKELF